MIFASKGYFGSKNCLREARAAVEKDKPLTIVHDPVRGGATLETIQETECPVAMHGAIFLGREVIEWHRIKVPLPHSLATGAPTQDLIVEHLLRQPRTFKSCHSSSSPPSFSSLARATSRSIKNLSLIHI